MVILQHTFVVMNNNYQRFAPLLLRLVIGYGSMAHGWVKLSRGPAGFERLLAYTHTPFAHLLSWIVPFVEVLGGLAILIGLLVRWVSVPLIITMLTAMLTIQMKYGFSSVNTIGLTPSGPLFGPPGFEINLLYIAGLLSLMITGAGALSVDSLRR